MRSHRSKIAAVRFPAKIASTKSTEGSRIPVPISIGAPLVDTASRAPTRKMLNKTASSGMCSYMGIRQHERVSSENCD